MIQITKVVTRNFFMDFVAKIQNWFGLNLTGYEKMMQEGIDQIKEELQKQEAKEMEWYRYEITQLTNGAVMILFYGEQK